jgi:hypothetical protein
MARHTHQQQGLGLPCLLPCPHCGLITADMHRAESLTCTATTCDLFRLPAALIDQRSVRTHAQDSVVSVCCSSCTRELSRHSPFQIRPLRPQLLPLPPLPDWQAR